MYRIVQHCSCLLLVCFSSCVLHRVSTHPWKSLKVLDFLPRCMECRSGLATDSDLFCNMRWSYHCLHHVLPPLRMVDKHKHLVVTLISYLNVVPTFTKNHLLFVPCMVLYKIHRFLLLSPPLYMFRFVLLCFFCLFVLLLIAMSCHCSVCVRLSHLIKDYLLTYLLTYGGSFGPGNWLNASKCKSNSGRYVYRSHSNTSTNTSFLTVKHDSYILQRIVKTCTDIHLHSKWSEIIVSDEVQPLHCRWEGTHFPGPFLTS